MQLTNHDLRHDQVVESWLVCSPCARYTLLSYAIVHRYETPSLPGRVLHPCHSCPPLCRQHALWRGFRTGATGARRACRAPSRCPPCICADAIADPNRRGRVGYGAALRNHGAYPKADEETATGCGNPFTQSRCASHPLFHAASNRFPVPPSFRLPLSQRHAVSKSHLYSCSTPHPHPHRLPSRLADLE